MRTFTQISSRLLSIFVFAAAACFGAALAKEPADNLTGPPFVTAKAWAIGDGKTGQFLWGLHEYRGIKSASTTKIMCAWLVLQLAKADPGVFEETITFSKLADDTSGSTADVRVGESLSIRECLYGLLLPSGNDAGNALAEHFNSRLAPPEQPIVFTGKEAVEPTTNLTTRANFIAGMNRAARKLGLTNTTYRIPYGDGGSDKDYTTTARDLLHLAWTAMQEPVFRQYVGTRRYECKVRTPDGQSRAVAWENTNQLLGIEGYDGVKTGTTTQAGNCLVASGWRGDDHLLIIVLGSESNAGRYVDARNLFRWAWQQRGHRPGEEKSK